MARLPARLNRPLAGWVALLLLLAPGLAMAQPLSDYRHSFGLVSLAFTGGFQVWTLDGVKDHLAERADIYAADGFNFSGAEFGPAMGFGTELQFRLTDHWFVRSQAEWTRMSFEDRDRQFVSGLGGETRTAISLVQNTKVQSRPFLFSFGLGRSHRFDSVRWGLSSNWVVAPVKVIDELQVHNRSTTETDVTSTGVGHGFELLLSVDYFTDTSMNLFIESYFRRGATVVEAESPEWEGSLIPSRRRVDFDGGGIRLGFRWI
ncbi:MAG: hypothetical protein DHS20C21_02110 [Gemmatimonadota bacterium]|nr:MAG: hypothetical protein DHS20C21_02110 [Gemmatimonadota bacterium]